MIMAGPVSEANEDADRLMRPQLQNLFWEELQDA